MTAYTSDVRLSTIVPTILSTGLYHAAHTAYDTNVSPRWRRNDMRFSHFGCAVRPYCHRFVFRHGVSYLCSIVTITIRFTVHKYGMSQANIDKLQRVQNILARVVVGAPWTSRSPYSSRFTLVTCWSSYYLQTVSHHLENTSYLSASVVSTCLNSFLTIFHPDPCIIPIQISLPDQPVLLATFPLGPFLCLHLLLLFTCTYSFYRHAIHL